MGKLFLLGIAFGCLVATVCGEAEAAKNAVNDAASETSGDAENKVSSDAEKEGKTETPKDASPKEEQDIYTKAASCPHRFHMGCMLDVVEKSCTGLQALTACANDGKCRDLDELERIAGALDPSNFEALNKCCCSKAYNEGGYEDCKTPDPVCKKAIENHVGKDVQKNAKLIRKCLKKRKKSVCKNALDAVSWVRVVARPQNNF